MSWAPDVDPAVIRAYMRTWRENNRDKERAYRERHRAKNPEKYDGSKRKWAKANPEKCAARTAVYRAVRDGVLTRPSQCSQCGSDRHIHAHHDDYTRQLEVRWLCAQCHRRHHAETGQP